MSAAPPIIERATGNLQWLVLGTQNGQVGVYDLVINPAVMQTRHFVFHSLKHHRAFVEQFIMMQKR